MNDLVFVIASVYKNMTAQKADGHIYRLLVFPKAEPDTGRYTAGCHIKISEKIIFR